MNKGKKIGICIVLLILTVCIVFLPKIASKYNEELLMDKKIYWNYDVRDKTKITSGQVAMLYINRDININKYSAISLDEGNYDVSLLQEKSIALFETVFESNASVFEHIKRIITTGSPRYTQTTTLVKIDNQPIALNFVNVSVATADSVIEFTYEEKTKTLISLYSLSLSYYLNYRQEDVGFLDSFKAVIKNYYENLLKINISEYYYENQSVEKDSIKQYYIGFGMIQNPTDRKDDEIKK